MPRELTNKELLIMKAASIAFKLSDPKVRAISMEFAQETIEERKYTSSLPETRQVLLIERGSVVLASTSETEQIGKSYLAAMSSKFEDTLTDESERISMKLLLPRPFPLQISELDDFYADAQWAKTHKADTLNAHIFAFEVAEKILLPYKQNYNQVNADVGRLRQWFIQNNLHLTTMTDLRNTA
jgi:hypothetical protein